MFGNAAKTSKKTGIFVSYRRADTAAYAGRLADRLRSRFDELFLDVDSINAVARAVIAI